jgi:fermentation-respiration switch protein FrsA (DUF1100 family)
MPVVWNTDERRHVATVRYIEPVTFAEWEDATNALLQTCAADLGLGWLIDRREVSAPPIRFAQSIAAYVTAQKSAFAGRRIALLVSDPGSAAYGMARMQEILNEAGGAVTRVFTSEAEALAWLTEHAAP